MKTWQLYSDFSQNYRAIIFNNIKVVSSTFVIDLNLEEGKGFNLDFKDNY